MNRILVSDYSVSGHSKVTRGRGRGEKKNSKVLRTRGVEICKMDVIVTNLIDLLCCK